MAVVFVLVGKKINRPGGLSPGGHSCKTQFMWVKNFPYEKNARKQFLNICTNHNKSRYIDIL